MTTDKTYTIGDAYTKASVTLENNHNVFEVCIDALGGKDHGEQISQHEYSDIVDQLIYDSCFYA